MTREMREIVDALESGSINGEPLTNETEMILQTELQKLIRYANLLSSITRAITNLLKAWK